jgi:hypothetical protein
LGWTKVLMHWIAMCMPARVDETRSAGGVPTTVLELELRHWALSGFWERADSWSDREG